MSNKRIFYACRRAGIAPPVGGTIPSFTTIRGLQSLNTTTTFRLEQVFELGQLAIYDNIEGVPDVEATLEKVLDGYPPAYLLATQMTREGDTPAKPTLVARAPTQCILGIQVFDETLAITGHEGLAENVPNVSGTGSGVTASGLLTEVHMSGLYTSSVRYQLGVDRNVTENLTLVGNNKVWVLGTSDTGNFSAEFQYGGGLWDTPWTGAGPTDGLGPLAGNGSGGVNRRQDVLMDPATAVANGANAYCILPLNIPGVVGSTGATPAYNHGTTYSGAGSGEYGINPLTNGQFPVHVQTWNVSVDLGREQLHELGRLGTYYRYVNWPVEVTNEIAVISTSGDMISAAEDGIYTAAGTGCGLKYNLKNYIIRLALCEGLIVDCGAMNKLRSVGMTGGDTGRGNVEVTYTYSNFNEFTVSHPSDPVMALRP